MIAIRPTPHVRKALAQRLSVRWPNAVVDHDIVQPLGPDAFLRVDHVFVYEDRKAQAAWAKLGCPEQRDEALVELQFHKNGFEVKGTHDLVASLLGLFA